MGLFHERTKYMGHPPSKKWMNAEKIMQELWNQENHPTANRGMNFGFGILQDLFIVPKEAKTGFPQEDNVDFFTTTLSHSKVVYRISTREHVIAATLMQWLGSPVGFGFIERFVNKCGYKLVKDEERQCHTA